MKEKTATTGITLAIMLALCLGTATTTIAQTVPYIDYTAGEIVFENGWPYNPSRLFNLTPQTDLQIGEAALATCGLSGYITRDLSDLHCNIYVKGSNITIGDKVVIGWSPSGKDPQSVASRYEISYSKGLSRVDVITGNPLATCAAVLIKNVTGGWTIEGKFPFTEIGLPTAGKNPSLLLSQIDTKMFDSEGTMVANGYYLSNCSAGYDALSKSSKWPELKLEIVQPSGNIKISVRELKKFNFNAGAKVEIENLDWHINRRDSGVKECYIQDDMSIRGIRLKWTDNMDSEIHDGDIVSSVVGIIEKQGKCSTLKVKDAEVLHARSIVIPHERIRFFSSKSLRNEPNNTGLLMITTGRVKQISSPGGCVAQLVISDGGEDIVVLLRSSFAAKVNDMVTVSGVSWIGDNDRLELRLADVTEVIEATK